jgi:carbon monoxide dehydrogenase subunit G
MQFQGQLSIKAPHAKVWELFQNVERVAACIPGCQSTELLEEGSYRAVLTEKLGPFRVSFDMKVRIDQVEHGRSIKASVTGEDRKLISTLRQTMQVTFQEIGALETQLDFSTEVSIFGKIGSLGYGMIKRKADETMKQFGEAVRAQLEGV